MVTRIELPRRRLPNPVRSISMPTPVNATVKITPTPMDGAYGGHVPTTNTFDHRQVRSSGERTLYAAFSGVLIGVG
jgi:hypothetical protein